MAENKPKWAFMAHYETGSGRVNDINAFSDLVNGMVHLD